MTGDDRLRAMLAAPPSRDDVHPGDVDPVGAGPAGVAPRARLRQVCALAVSELGVSGAAISAMSDAAAATAGSRHLLHAHDPVSRDLEDAQLVAGHGPCLEAVSAGVPVLVPDLDAEGRWPGLVPAARTLGVAAAFSFPLLVGGAPLGSLNLWRDRPGPLGSVDGGLLLAGAATEALLDEINDHASRPPAERPGDGWPPEVHAEVHQASGMVAIDLGIRADAALLRLRSHAFARGLSIEEVARRVVHEGFALEPDR